MGGDPKLADRSRYKEPDEVAAAVEQALFEPTPKRRYVVVPDAARGRASTIRKAIEELVQLNEGQPYTYSRDALVGMLDEALKTARPATLAARPRGGERRLSASPESLPADVAAARPAVFAASGFVAEAAERDPGLLSGLAETGELGRRAALG